MTTLFDGITATKADEPRLNAQLQRVFNAMAYDRWMTPEQITAATGDEWCSASARIRDLRKQKHGGWDVQRRSVGGGLFEYRLCSRGG